jgi:hypothetical protein
MADRPGREHTDPIMFTSRNSDTPSFERALALFRERGADEAFQHYLDWRQESSTCDAAYRVWASTSNSSDRPLAYATYAAALDREQQAAAQYKAVLLGGWGRCGSLIDTQ